MRLILACLILINVANASEMDVHQLWKNYLNNDLTGNELITFINKSNPKELSLIDHLRLEVMQSDLLDIKASQVMIEELSPNEALAIASENEFFAHKILLSKKAHEQLITAQLKLDKVSKVKPLTKNQIKQILNYRPNHKEFYDGKYEDTLTLFLICRKDRNYPCRFIFKDLHGEFVRKDNGQLWSIASLAKSRLNRNYNITNGQTPIGVHRVDSVMPYANREKAFGKFRRIILNWVKADNKEANTKALLPLEHRTLRWWHQASIARDAGRKHLRIHGTGASNKNPLSTYFPHVPTSGCISTLEGRYGNKIFKDQRVLLDKLMENSQLAPVYSNEVYIKGILYVLEIDSLKKAVSVDDINSILN